MATLFIGVLLLAILFLAIRSTIRTIRFGCCGSADCNDISEKKQANDHKHYHYKKVLEIEGMTCGHCIRRVQNRLNALDGVYATVTLGKATVLMERKLSDCTLREAISGSGYIVSKIDSEGAV